MAQIVFNVSLSLQARFSLGASLYGSVHLLNTESAINSAAGGTHTHTHAPLLPVCCFFFVFFLTHKTRIKPLVTLGNINI